MTEIEKSIEAMATSGLLKAKRCFPKSDDARESLRIFKNTKHSTTENIEKIIDQMANNWPSNLVARKAIGEFSGGILSPKTCANEDSAGTGIEGRFLLMNQMCYPVDSVIAWMKSRSAKSWKERRRR